jgi:hypothetical protein
MYRKFIHNQGRQRSFLFSPKTLRFIAVLLGPLSFLMSCDLLTGTDPTRLQSHNNANVTVDIAGITMGSTDLYIAWSNRSQEVSRVELSVQRADTGAVVLSPVSIPASTTNYHLTAAQLTSGTPLGITLILSFKVYNADNVLTNTVTVDKDTAGNPIRFIAPVIDLSGGAPTADYTDVLGNSLYLRSALNGKSMSMNSSSGSFTEGRFELFKLNLDGSMNATRVASFTSPGGLPSSFNLSSFVFDAPVTAFGDLDADATYVIRVRGYIDVPSNAFVENTISLPLFSPDKIWVKSGPGNGLGNKVQGYSDFATACAEAQNRLGAPLNQATVQLYLQQGDSFALDTSVVIPSAVVLNPGYDFSAVVRTGSTTLAVGSLGKLTFLNGATVNAGLIVNANSIEPPMKLLGAGTYDFISLNAHNAYQYLYDVDSGAKFGLSYFGGVVFEMIDADIVNFSGLTVGTGVTRIGGIIARNSAGTGQINFLDETQLNGGAVYANGVGIDFQGNSRFLYAPSGALSPNWGGANYAFGIFLANAPRFTTTSNWQVAAVASVNAPNKRWIFCHIQNSPTTRVITIQASSITTGFTTNANDNDSFDVFSFLNNPSFAGSINVSNMNISVTALPDGLPANLIIPPRIISLTATTIDTLNAVGMTVVPSAALYATKPITYIYESTSGNINMFTNCLLARQAGFIIGFHDFATATDIPDNTLINDYTVTTQNGAGSAAGNTFLP